MAKLKPRPKPSTQPYYPSPAKTGPLHDDLRLLFDHVYSLQDRLAAVDGRVKSVETKQVDPTGPSTTKIAGLYVKGTPPTNGQKLTYNSATGQIEWQ